MTDREAPYACIARAAARRRCPVPFRQARRRNKRRVPQETVERLIDEGLLRWGNLSRTFVVVTERGGATNGH